MDGKVTNVPYSRSSKEAGDENVELTSELPQDVDETVREDLPDPDVEIVKNVDDLPNETVQQCEAHDITNHKFNVPVEDTTHDPNREPSPEDKDTIETPITETVAETETNVVPCQESPQDCDDADNCDTNPKESALGKKERKNLDNVKIKKNMKRDVGKEKLTPVNPLAELHELGKCLGGTEGGPPFNFQKMLRKTNFQRDSLKRAVEKLKGTTDESDDVEKKDEKRETEAVPCEKNMNIMNDINDEQKECRTDISFAKIISTEIYPGIVLEGVLFEI